MRAEARAKVNLSLTVRGRRADGLHDLVGVTASVSLADLVTLEHADDDEFVLDGPGPGDETNLAWRAVESARRWADVNRPLRMSLVKRIPIAAGLGGGSADAAAVLGLSGHVLGLPPTALSSIAPSLGADVPFCLAGGLAVVGGTGDEISALPFTDRFALALVVPPFELETARVYRRWDELNRPQTYEVSGADLPPSLRDLEPLRNDLWPAALALAPELGEWRAELAGRWGRPVSMSGSGSSLFAFAIDRDEADGLVAEVPDGSRHASAVDPRPRGWEVVPDTLSDGEWGVV